MSSPSPSTSSSSMQFTSPCDALLGGRGGFSTDATNLNVNAGQADPAGVDLSAATDLPSLVGPGTFNAPDLAGQAIVTDPNVGLQTPGMMTYGPDSLANPLAGPYPYDRRQAGLSGAYPPGPVVGGGS